MEKIVKLLIKLSYNTTIAVPAENAGLLVPAFAQAIRVEKPYRETRYKTIADDDKIEFSFEQDEMFDALPEPLAQLQKSRTESEEKYLNEWTAKQEALKKVAELEKKLAAFKSAVESESI